MPTTNSDFKGRRAVLSVVLICFLCWCIIQADSASLPKLRLAAHDIPQRVLPGSYRKTRFLFRFTRNTTTSSRQVLTSAKCNNTFQLVLNGLNNQQKTIPMSPNQNKGLQRLKFKTNLQMPNQEGIYQLNWTVISTNPRCKFDMWMSRTLNVEVTCTDGIFCNGQERMVNGSCRSSTRAACDDGVECTIDSCDEVIGRCNYTLSSASCASCQQDCVPTCTEGVCSFDETCQVPCNPCDTGYNCQSGTCVPYLGIGSCNDPYDFFGIYAQQNNMSTTPALLFDMFYIISGDTSNDPTLFVLSCNTSPAVPNRVYVLNLPANQQIGIDARVSGFDTVMELRSTCSNGSPPSLLACSDDASPPGNFGSSFRVMLNTQTNTQYYLIVSGYSSINTGVFSLSVLFSNSCVPQCDSIFCGPNECGNGSCGACPPLQTCDNSDSHCRPIDCISNCTNQQCGDDGCGGQCAAQCNAPIGSLCQEDPLDPTVPHTCAVFETCNHMEPTCSPSCSGDYYCGSDCTCHLFDGDEPDLVTLPEYTASSLEVSIKYFNNRSCAWAESCVSALGNRTLLRFTTQTLNQGRASLSPPNPPWEYPNLYVFAPCHQHFHFEGFAVFELREKTNQKVLLKGQKKAYCMEDSVQDLLGPNIKCDPTSLCSEQGIQVGWSDSYGSDLDCQWLDITDLPQPETYVLNQYVNPLRVFHEASFDNNLLSTVLCLSNNTVSVGGCV